MPDPRPSPAGGQTAAIDVLMVGPLLPALAAEVRQRYRAHHWWEAADPARLLAEHGERIRAIVTTARFGATRALIESLPRLEVIVSFGVGLDPIDMDAARERGIVVTNTPGVLEDCVADTAMSLVLSVARRICELDRFVRSGGWRAATPPLGRRLAGRCCGILGLGSIGLKIARRAEAFGMEVAYHNRRPRQDAPAHYRYCPDLPTLAARSAFLVLAVPGSAQTHRLVDAAILDALGPDGVLINVARGSVVDEAALVDALRDGRLGGAGLDVYQNEPEVPAALCAMDNVVLLPHVGGSTVETRQAMAQLFMRNLDGWFERRQPATPVT
ncbi:2-hydroxyacid dehydrogenase [Bordetella genomosp. 6]|uniref:2-hydroxyacid dehydrogenase n=1 Tax=Bordetella genomosp. 6 TaxID=463024 RepID=UPI000A2966BC|nr:2-hydroxyacid dehydrogenase [Bordetella genomosp. 6]ARP78795.1 hydroxyacid dehydrogenase [Bordetella genomosp. 6]